MYHNYVMPEISYNSLLISAYQISSILKKTVYKSVEQNNNNKEKKLNKTKQSLRYFFCQRHLARVIYKIRLNS